MDTTLLFTLLISGLVILITQLAKKKGYDQKIVTLILVVILAGGYYSFRAYLPFEMQQHVIYAVTSIAGTAKILYDAITALLPKKEVLETN